MKAKFKKQPMCEILGNVPATHFTWRYSDRRWRFISTQAPQEPDEYCFRIDGFFLSPAAIVDWLAHLSEKKFFDPVDFLAMIHRFREATGSYGVLKA